MLLFKPFQLEDCSLKTRRIDIWQYSLHLELPKFYQLLNPIEQQRAERFHFAHHRRRFIAAHAILRLILARYLHTEAKQLEFSANKYGKPHLANIPQFEFNLSHSGELALLAVGKKLPIGIDLEFFSPRPYGGIGHHIFSAAENQQLERLPNCLKPLAFFHTWVQKEAFIKACGLGLSYPTQDFDVPILLTGRQLVADRKHQRLWQVISFMPQVTCYAALCCHPQIGEIRYLSLPDIKYETL